jgi:hypothetical protein
VQRGSISSRLIVGAVLVLAAVAAVDALMPGSSSKPSSSPPATLRLPELRHAGGRPAVERIGTAWVRRFAANGLHDCFHTGRGLCVRLKRERPAYRRSFRSAGVDDVVVSHYEALAMLSNGERIRLEADGGTWWVLALGRHVGRGFFEKPG